MSLFMHQPAPPHVAHLGGALSLYTEQPATAPAPPTAIPGIYPTPAKTPAPSRTDSRTSSPSPNNSPPAHIGSALPAQDSRGIQEPLNITALKDEHGGAAPAFSRAPQRPPQAFPDKPPGLLATPESRKRECSSGEAARPAVASPLSPGPEIPRSGAHRQVNYAWDTAAARTSRASTATQPRQTITPKRLRQSQSPDARTPAGDSSCPAPAAKATADPIVHIRRLWDPPGQYAEAAPAVESTAASIWNAVGLPLQSSEPKPAESVPRKRARLSDGAAPGPAGERAPPPGRMQPLQSTTAPMPPQMQPPPPPMHAHAPQQMPAPPQVPQPQPPQQRVQLPQQVHVQPPPLMYARTTHPMHAQAAYSMPTQYPYQMPQQAPRPFNSAPGSFDAQCLPPMYAQPQPLLGIQPPYPAQMQPTHPMYAPPPPYAPHQPQVHGQYSMYAPPPSQVHMQPQPPMLAQQPYPMYAPPPRPALVQPLPWAPIPPAPHTQSALSSREPEPRDGNTTSEPERGIPHGNAQAATVSVVADADASLHFPSISTEFRPRTQTFGDLSSAGQSAPAPVRKVPASVTDVLARKPGALEPLQLSLPALPSPQLTPPTAPSSLPRAEPSLPPSLPSPPLSPSSRSSAPEPAPPLAPALLPPSSPADDSPTPVEHTSQAPGPKTACRSVQHDGVSGKDLGDVENPASPAREDCSMVDDDGVALCDVARPKGYRELSSEELRVIDYGFEYSIVGLGSEAPLGKSTVDEMPDSMNAEEVDDEAPKVKKKKSARFSEEAKVLEFARDCNDNSSGDQVKDEQLGDVGPASQPEDEHLSRSGLDDDHPPGSGEDTKSLSVSTEDNGQTLSRNTEDEDIPSSSEDSECSSREHVFHTRLVKLPSGYVCTVEDVKALQTQLSKLDYIGNGEGSSRSPQAEDSRSSRELHARIRQVTNLLHRILLEPAAEPALFTDTEGTSRRSSSPEDETSSDDDDDDDDAEFVDCPSIPDVLIPSVPESTVSDAKTKPTNLTATEPSSTESRTPAAPEDIFPLLNWRGIPCESLPKECWGMDDLRAVRHLGRCPEMAAFLARARCVPGLRTSQLFEASWVLHNLFDVHGGIMTHWLHRSLDRMRDLAALPSEADALGLWDGALLQELDVLYCETLRPVLDLDGRHGSRLADAWIRYRTQVTACLAAHATRAGSPFDAKRAQALLPTPADNCLVPILTEAFLADFNALWAAVDPALKEVARWFEPFVDYGPDAHRARPFHDATLVIARHLRANAALASPEQALEQIWTLLRCRRSSSLSALSVSMKRVAADHQTRRAAPLLSMDARYPDMDWHIAQQSMALLCGGFVPAQLLATSLELRALEATHWTWKTSADRALWAARMAFALQEADVVLAYCARLVHVPHVAQLRRALLGSCHRRDFWDGLTPAEDAPLAFLP